MELMLRFQYLLSTNQGIKQGREKLLLMFQVFAPKTCNLSMSCLDGKDLRHILGYLEMPSSKVANYRAKSERARKFHEQWSITCGTVLDVFLTRCCCCTSYCLHQDLLFRLMMLLMMNMLCNLMREIWLVKLFCNLFFYDLELLL